MSHNSVYKATCNRLDLLEGIVGRLGGKFTLTNEVKLYGSNKTPSMASIKLPGWRYDIAVTTDGELIYDHFGSGAGSMDKLHSMVQMYNEEVTTEKVVLEQAMGSNINAYWVEDQANGDRVMVIDYE
jgi:hypothetical protein